MIFIFADDRTLFVVADVHGVRVHCETIDVVEGVYTFYDSSGRPLIPRVTKTERRVLRLFTEVEYDYTLEPGDVTAQLPIAEVLKDAAWVHPNDWFSDLNAVCNYFEAV